ncbi:MAG: ATP-binding protein [Planctomycetota bacterium]|nr:ATP-binding protein [Planctomycetota bacterium]
MSGGSEQRAAPASIRRRVLVGTLSITALAIAAAGWAVEGIVRSRLVETHSSSLVAVLEGGMLRACAESRHVGRRLPDGTEREWFLADGDTSGHLWLVRRPGADDPIAASAGFPDGGAPRTDAPLERATDAVLREVASQEGEPYRVASFVVTPADLLPPRPEGAGDPDPRGRSLEGGPGDRGLEGRQRAEGDRRPRLADRRRPLRRPPESFGLDERFEVFVAASIADERSTLAELRRALFGSGLGAILISALLIMVVVRRGVAPLQALSIRVADLDESNLGERIEAPDATAELVPIVTALEATRARLSHAFQRERRFTADAAHELRTPLAGLRATLEVALRRERTVEAHREYAGQCLAVARSMEDTLEGLLMLARADEIAERVEKVDLVDELDRALAAVQPEFEAQRLTLTTVIEPGLSPVISSVAALVERIVSNLVRNVVAHATPGSAVTSALRAEGAERVAITVSNDCAPMPPDTSERAFEAFWRADEARAGEGEHVGLGLALVAKAAEALGGTSSIAVEAPEEGSARFSVTVTLPRAVAG